VSAILYIEMIDEWLEEQDEKGVCKVNADDLGDLIRYLQSLQPVQADLFSAGSFHASDPETSRKAATKPSNVIRFGTQRYQLLHRFILANDTGLTDEEAGKRAGVGGYNERRRCSDLRRMGLIEPTGTTRRTDTGHEAMVCRATDAGRRAHLDAIRYKTEENSCSSTTTGLVQA